MSAIDHDEIYLQPVCCVNEDIGRLWCEDVDPEDCEDGKHWTRYVRADIHESAIAELVQLRQERDGLLKRVAHLETLKRAAIRVVGEHTAPNDCYATGPLTGDPFADFVECPSCTFLKLINNAGAAMVKEQGE